MYRKIKKLTFSFLKRRIYKISKFLDIAFTERIIIKKKKNKNIQKSLNYLLMIDTSL